ncbi:MAG: ATPase, T2SS/T4P/T4SS family [Clostridia bacterium]|nr:ATPase, T2SS/T4P/T4SS family [Clostridia bacterium]MDY5264541.1 ATPase, T2SS/T4P/T4SS family [Eubacteriales bacterium]
MDDKIILGQVLLDKGIVNQEQLNDAMRWQKLHPSEELGDILLGRGIVNEGQLLEAYAEKMNTTYVDRDLVVRKPEVLKLVTENIAMRHCVMPIDINNNKIVVAMCNPNDLSAIEDIKLSAKMEVTPLLTSKVNIENALDRYYKNAEVFYKEEAKAVNLVSDETAKKMDEIESSVNNTPVVKLVNNLVQQAYVRKASDIHIEPFEHQVLVRMRIDGDLVECLRLSPSSLNSVISRIKILSDMNIAEKRIPQDGRFRYQTNEISVDLRVSTLPTVWGEKCVMRLLNTGGDNLLSFEQLGMTKENIEKFNKICSAPNGIILVTGPTGSGKSTTLYAVLNKLNKPNVNLSTVEDPVEKQMFGINQVQINTKAGLTFASALRSLLRQDPDVVMVGEIRDYETAEIATRAAITGHLVLSTLHTNDSIATITRLIDMGIPNYMVSASVNAIIAQRLVKRLCPYCKKKRQATDLDRAIMSDDTLTEIYEPKGCPECNQSGYSGRIAVHEVLELDHRIKALIMQNAPLSEIKKVAIENGTEFLADNLRELVKNGITSMDEYQRLIYTVS